MISDSRCHYKTHGKCFRQSITYVIYEIYLIKWQNEDNPTLPFLFQSW